MSRDEFINDPGITLVGYQVDFNKLEAGFFLFNHSCQDTLAVTVDNFKSMYSGPIFRERKTGGESCPGHCLHQDNLSPCPAKCECAFVRDIMQQLKKD